MTCIKGNWADRDKMGNWESMRQNDCIESMTIFGKLQTSWFGKGWEILKLVEWWEKVEKKEGECH